MSFESLHALLADSGYELRYRESEWVECLLLRDSEAWVGRGRDRVAALRAAVLLACPSSLARGLLEARLRETIGAPLLENGSGPHVSLVAEGHDRSDGVEGAADQVGHGKVVDAYDLRAPTRPLGSERRPSSGRPFSSVPPLVRRDSAPTRNDPMRALEELDILLERVKEYREELGLSAPERQRLAMLSWICEARAYTDSFPDDIRIRDRVGAISRQLTEYGKTFWPGSVTALQLQMHPRDLPRHVLGAVALTWARASELAERALHTSEYADERRGFDAYGWADASQMLPPPENPGGLFDALVSEVEAFGVLLPYAMPKDNDARPSPEVYRRWVRTLRWLRASEVDADRWARVAGRLRWWATNREAQLSSHARELEAVYVPTRAWAEEVGGDARAAPVEPPAAAIDAVRTTTSGKRIVFVSNRRDPDQEQQLKALFSGATLEWRVPEPRRLELLQDAIHQRAFDVVLAAIGFQSLATDQILARSCKSAGVQYLRVNRGLPRTCLRAFMRDR